MDYNLVIKDGQVITPHDTFTADVGINGERITTIGRGLSGRRELDARGLYVIPGAIDGHVHLTDPDYAPLYPPNADSFAVGTRAGAFGGVTSFVDFAAHKAGLNLVEALEHLRDLQAGRSIRIQLAEQLLGGQAEVADLPGAGQHLLGGGAGDLGDRPGGHPLGQPQLHPGEVGRDLSLAQQRHRRQQVGRGLPEQPG